MNGRRATLFPLLALALLALGGCLGTGESGDPAGKDDGNEGNDGNLGDGDPQVVVPPPGCDASRALWLHGADGAVTPTFSEGIPCFHVTPWDGFEPTVGITSDGALFLYPVELPQLPPTDPEIRYENMAMARSLDGGATFERLESKIGPVSYHGPVSFDPFLYVDPYTDRVFIEDLILPPFNCANMSYSDDRGETWRQTLAGCMVWDHVGYGSGPPIVSQTRDGYPTVLQRCAMTYVATTAASEASGCQKSLDGGATWERPGEPPFLFGPDGLPYVPTTCDGGVHHVFVDHRGWTWLGRVWCDGYPYLAMSKDEGATWVRLRVSDMAAAGHDVGVGVDPVGRVYASWTGTDSQVYMSRSDDDGAAWTPPIRVSPEGVTAAGFVSITPGGGGKAAFSYVAELADDPGALHAVVVAATGLESVPRFVTAILTTSEAPLVAQGNCSNDVCTGQGDFLDSTIGPDGIPWGSFLQEEKLAGGRIWGAPSLWDETDRDGVYGGWETTPAVG